MATKNYNFVKYEQELIEHLERHLDGSHIAGSHFMKGAFKDAKELIDFAYEHIKDDYTGQRFVKEVDLENIVGYDSLVNIEQLPENAYVVKEPRGRNEFLANMVSGVEKKPTKHVVIVAGPLRVEKGEQEKHGFYTIFPGINAPSFPVTEKQLVEWGYKGQNLEEQIKINKQYAEFWDKHGFVKEENTK